VRRPALRCRAVRRRTGRARLRRARLRDRRRERAARGRGLRRRDEAGRGRGPDRAGHRHRVRAGQGWCRAVPRHLCRRGAHRVPGAGGLGRLTVPGRRRRGTGLAAVLHRALDGHADRRRPAGAGRAGAGLRQRAGRPVHRGAGGRGRPGRLGRRRPAGRLDVERRRPQRLAAEVRCRPGSAPGPRAAGAGRDPGVPVPDPDDRFADPDAHGGVPDPDSDLRHRVPDPAAGHHGAGHPDPDPDLGRDHAGRPAGHDAGRAGRHPDPGDLLAGPGTADRAGAGQDRLGRHRPADRPGPRAAGRRHRAQPAGAATRRRM
ncbi:MAG: hypothetical protein AVDCRST_MAG41-3242, partial [uncultured Corynebacteriales bacterium]